MNISKISKNVPSVQAAQQTTGLQGSYKPYRCLHYRPKLSDPKTAASHRRPSQFRKWCDTGFPHHHCIKRKNTVSTHDLMNTHSQDRRQFTCRCPMVVGHQECAAPFSHLLGWASLSERYYWCMEELPEHSEYFLLTEHTNESTIHLFVRSSLLK